MAYKRERERKEGDENICFAVFLVTLLLFLWVPRHSNAVGDGEMGKVADTGHVSQSDARIARSRLNAQLIVQIAAVTAITNHVNFIYKRHTKNLFLEHQNSV